MDLLHWYSSTEMYVFFIYLFCASIMMVFALIGTFSCPKKLSSTWNGVFFEMAANGSNKSYMEYMVFVFVVGGSALVLQWKLFAILIATLAFISYIQSKIFEFRRRRWKIAEAARKERERRNYCE